MPKEIIHCARREGEYPNYKFTALCGAELIPFELKRHTDTPFKNLSYYGYKINCKICLDNMDDPGSCPKCGCEFDTTQDTYCGNCGKKTRKPRKLRIRKPKPETIKSMEEFQKRYFPNKVGKECPYCGHKLSKDKPLFYIKDKKFNK